MGGDGSSSLRAVMVTLFAALAVTLAMVGIFGILGVFSTAHARLRGASCTWRDNE